MRSSARKALSRTGRVFLSVFYGIVLLAAIAVLVIAALEERQRWSLLLYRRVLKMFRNRNKILDLYKNIPKSE